MYHRVVDSAKVCHLRHLDTERRSAEYRHVPPTLVSALVSILSTFVVVLIFLYVMVVVQGSASGTAELLISPRPVSFASVILPYAWVFRLLRLLISDEPGAFSSFTPDNFVASCRQQPHHLEIHSREQGMETPPLHEPFLCRH